MTGESYNTAPNGNIVVRGKPETKVEKILTEAVLPGHLLQIDSNDYKAKLHDGSFASGAGCIGWAGFEDASPNVRPDTYDTAYVSGNVIPVLSGGSFDIYAIAIGEAVGGAAVTITTGDLLTSNGDGTLKLSSLAVTITQSGETPFAVSAATLPARPVARALETVVIAVSTTATPNTARIHVTSLV